MLVRYADWKKPTDDAFAFQLKAPGALASSLPAHGTETDIRSVVRECLDEDSAARFERLVNRWDGPERRGATGELHQEPSQRLFAELPWRPALTSKDIDATLSGRVLVLRRATSTDYVMRDHHMIDVALYHYRTTGELPNGLFHADRHSDYCRDSFLSARRPDQAATWWKLFEGLKRPDGTSVLSEDRVYFAHAKATHRPWMSGRDLDEPLAMPWFLTPEDLPWERTLEREGALQADWVSIDLDYLQPSPQLALTKGLLRDVRFRDLMRNARVRVFVLSPQFTNGGDKLAAWAVHGRMTSTLRLLNLLRRSFLG